jgi:pyruvate formate lyase activating enzyme
LSEGLVDYVAMDVKAPPTKYPLLTGCAEIDVARIEQSIALLKASAIEHEFRTTVVPGLLDEDDVDQIALWIAGAERYVLQQFRPLHTLDPALEEVTPYPVDRLQEMAERAGQYASQVAVRGAATSSP